MKFYVSSKAIEELNKNGETAILNENGEETDAYIKIYDGRPLIENFFGSDEGIYLDRLHADCDGDLECKITTHKCDQYFRFRVLRRVEESFKTSWEAQ